jgi:hypothetical protein
MLTAMEARGMKPAPFLARKGQVLLWHGCLVHGGSPVADASKTRRSFVVHYAREDQHPNRGTAVALGGDRQTLRTVERYVGRRGTVGFHNPTAGLSLRRWAADQPADDACAALEKQVAELRRKNHALRDELRGVYGSLKWRVSLQLANAAATLIGKPLARTGPVELARRLAKRLGSRRE